MSPEMQKHFEHQIDLAERHAADMEKRVQDCEKDAKEYAEASRLSRDKAEQFKALLEPKADGPVHVVGHPQALSKEQSTQLRNSLEALMGGTVVILDGGATLYPPR